MLVSYMYLPEQDKKLIRDHVDETHKQLPDNIRFVYRAKALEAYPGTKLMHRFADKLVPDVYFKDKGEDMWIPGAFN